MSFWKRKKKHGVEVKHIPLPILIRQVIYDSMLEPAEGIAEAMGLPPISEEVSEMEARASQERLERFSSLLPFIDSHSDMAARITAAAYIIDADEDAIIDINNDEDVDAITSLFKLVALSANLSCISTLFNLGLLESKAVNHGK